MRGQPGGSRTTLGLTRAAILLIITGVLLAVVDAGPAWLGLLFVGAGVGVSVATYFIGRQQPRPPVWAVLSDGCLPRRSVPLPSWEPALPEPSSRALASPAV